MRRTPVLATLFFALFWVVMMSIGICYASAVLTQDDMTKVSGGCLVLALGTADCGTEVACNDACDYDLQWGCPDFKVVNGGTYLECSPKPSGTECEQGARVVCGQKTECHCAETNKCVNTDGTVLRYVSYYKPN